VIARITTAVVVTLLVALLIAGRATGWRWMRVVSPSMEPGLGVGTFVLVRPAAGDAVAVGDVIAFRDPTNPGRQVLHRVTNRIGEPPVTALETKGDANPLPDSYPVPADLVIGRLAGEAPPVLLIRAASLALTASSLGALALDERKRRQSARGRRGALQACVPAG